MGYHPKSSASNNHKGNAYLFCINQHMHIWNIKDKIHCKNTLLNIGLLFSKYFTFSLTEGWWVVKMWKWIYPYPFRITRTWVRPCCFIVWILNSRTSFNFMHNGHRKSKGVRNVEHAILYIQHETKWFYPHPFILIWYPVLQMRIMLIDM